MRKLLFFSFIVIIFNTQLDYVNSDLQVGETCTVRTTGATGTCKLITQCRSVIRTLKTQPATTCGYKNSKQIVCCPNPPTTPTTAAPLSESVLNSKRYLKCMEYGKAVYQVSQRIPLDNGTIYEYKTDTCGFIVIPLIVNGTAALPKEFPHSALLGYQGNPHAQISWDCGGSLLSETFVLTAGHCLKSKYFGYVKFVKLGDLNIASDTDDAMPEIINISEMIPHPNYNKKFQYNDIALLRLEKSATISAYIRPICLPLVNSINNEKVIATGWGATEWGGNSSSSLLKVTLDLVTYSECNQSFKYHAIRKLPNGIVDDTQLCAGSRDSIKDTCQGDSGGPLQVYNSDVYCMYTILGVTSFGKVCGSSASNPGIYTRVFPFVEWIERVVWPN